MIINREWTREKFEMPLCIYAGEIKPMTEKVTLADVLADAQLNSNDGQSGIQRVFDAHSQEYRPSDAKFVVGYPIIKAPWENYFAEYAGVKFSNGNLQGQLSHGALVLLRYFYQEQLQERVVFRQDITQYSREQQIIDRQPTTMDGQPTTVETLLGELTTAGFVVETRGEVPYFSLSKTKLDDVELTHIIGYHNGNKPIGVSSGQYVTNMTD